MKPLIFNSLMWLLLCTSLFSCKDQISQEDGDSNDLSKYSNQVILDWNMVALEAMGGETYPLPLVNSRINAMMHIAMHDAINAIVPKYETYAFQGKNSYAHPVAAAASAAHAVLEVHFSDQKAMLDEHLYRAMSTIKDEEKKNAGIEIGKAAAASILALRDNDGAFQDPIGSVEPSTDPGLYQLVPPFEFAYAEFWKTMKPFALKRSDQFRSEPFPNLGSKKYADDYEEVKRIGQLNSPYRTEDETFVAKFWYELAEIGWNKIARIVAADKKLDLFTTARLFALLDIATADAYIAGWDGKYYFKHWRPYTAIRAIDDGNDHTSRDEVWEPCEPTPPVPDYPSTHSALGNAAATVLAHIIGDHTSFAFASSTGVPSEKSRSFTSFSQAANENARSRVLAGIHFTSACHAGQKLGDEVGEWVIDNYLKPLD